MISFKINTNPIQEIIRQFSNIFGSLIRKQQREQLILPIITKLLNIKIITRKQIVCDAHHSCIKYFGEKEQIQPTNPNCIGQVPEGIQIIKNRYTIDKPFVLEIKDAQLVSITATGFDNNGNIIAETTLPPLGNLSPRFQGSIPIKSLLIKKIPSLETSHIDTACSLVNFWSKTYYHWFIDCLTRIEGLEYYQKETGCKPVLIIDSNPTSWQVESLKLLGYNQDDYILWDKKTIHVKKLIIPSFRQPGNWVSSSGLHWLRQRIFSHLNISGNGQNSFSPRVYISRSKASGRKIINEDEVIELLAGYGFVCYCLETMTFMEQIKLFSSAEIIIGPHGAGFTNIIFSQKKPVIIEFTTPWISPHYFLISNILDFPYWCIESNQPYFENLRQTRGDMVVNIANLKSLIHQLNL